MGCKKILYKRLIFLLYNLHAMFMWHYYMLQLKIFLGLEQIIGLFYDDVFYIYNMMYIRVTMIYYFDTTKRLKLKSVFLYIYIFKYKICKMYKYISHNIQRIIFSLVRLFLNEII